MGVKPITPGLCQCGCGEATKSPNGTPNKYVNGHASRRRQPGETVLRQGHKYMRVDGVMVAEHRLAMERVFGRRLRSDEIVHHVDGDPTNNDPDNLLVTNRSDHLVLHLRQMPVEPWTAAELCEAVERHQAGESIEAIAQALGKGYYAVRRRLAKARNGSSPDRGGA